MSYSSMWAELLGMVPKFPVPLAKKAINRAWKDVRQFNLWSFQLYDGPQWITPPPVTTGRATLTRGSATVTIDATGIAAINANAIANPYSAIPQRQFRVALGTIYNIVSWDGAGTLTLDRPYGEIIAGATTGFMIFQNYYAAPFQDHETFITVRNMARFMDLFLDKKRSQIDMMDPQRSYSYWPTDCVFYKVDDITTSTTYRYPLYELWGVPIDQYTYNLYGIRNMPDLVNPTDTLPVQIQEDVVIERAKYYVYQWAEANKSQWGITKGGPDYRYLMGEANKEYLRLVRDYRHRDRDRVDNWTFTRKVSLYGNVLAYYNTATGRGYPGRGNW